MKRGFAWMLALALLMGMLSPVGAMAETGEELEALRKAWAVGKTVKLGQCEQDGYLYNGPETIEWLVVDEDGDRRMLVSKYAILLRPFHDVQEDATWETCTLRAWLNDEFYHSAFTAQEQAAIAVTHVDNSIGQATSVFRRSGGGDTEDRIFLLSGAEREKYFPGDKGRNCRTTNYMGMLHGNEAQDNVSWILRSPGKDAHSCFLVVEYRKNAYPSEMMMSTVVWSKNLVRPAMWVDLEALCESDASDPAQEETAAEGTGYKPGDTLFFGRYEQDGNEENGPEAIEWIVLDTDGARVLLLSRYGLDAVPFDSRTKREKVLYWENCTLRAWLLGDFMKAAFSGAERRAILTTHVMNLSHGGDWGSGGTTTDDKLFLLSYREGQFYIVRHKSGGDSDAINHGLVEPTQAAIDHGAGMGCYSKEDEGYGWNWWLRTPFLMGDGALCMFGVDDGKVVHTAKPGTALLVRPALWLDLTYDPDAEQTPDYPTLQRGDKSESVKTMQEKLIVLGYLTGKADGDFGKMTEAAVKAAQADFGMEQTGVADAAFQAELYSW